MSRVEVWTWGMCQEPRETKLGVAKNRNIGAEKVLELAFFFFNCRRDKDLKSANYLFVALLMSLNLGGERI